MKEVSIICYLLSLKALIILIVTERKKSFLCTVDKEYEVTIKPHSEILYIKHNCRYENQVLL